MAKSVLYHHGITGMKWGTRNGPPYPLGSSAMTSVQRKSNTVSKWARENISKYGMPSKGSSSTNVRVKRSKTSQDSKTDDKEERHLTDEQKATIKKVAIGAGVVAGAAVLAYSTKQINTAAKLGIIGKGKDYVIKSGTEFSRMAEKEFSHYTENVYTAYRVSDRDLYTGVYGKTKLLRSARAGKSHIELNKITSNAAHDLRMPSKKTRLDVFDEVIKESPDDVVNSINAQIKRRIDQGKKMKYITADDLKFKNNKEKLNIYNKWQDSLSLLNETNVDNKGIKTYVNKLKERGYHGILDENDNRIGKYKSKAPTILFDTNESLTNVHRREITPGEILNAYDRNKAKQAVRGNVLLRGKNTGMEKFKTDSRRKVRKYAATTAKDKRSLNPNYTNDHLMKDFNDHLSSKSIRKINSYMDSGLTYEQARAKIKGANRITKFVNKFYV